MRLQLFFLFTTLSTIACDEFKITDQVYFDVNIDGKHAGKIIFGLFGEVAPKTCRNFKHLAVKGLNGKSYTGTKFLYALKRFIITGGDIVNNNGTGSISIYGKYFEDENFTIKHESAGLLSSVNNRAPNTNGCQFLITTIATPVLDGVNVVFGKVLKGHDVVHKIEHLKTDINDRIISSVVISRSGSIKTTPFYESAKNYELSFYEWIKAGWVPLSFSFGIMGVFHYIMMQLNKYQSFK